jgi:hypothetical protein
MNNPYVIKAELLEPTGVERVDDTLYSLVNVLALGVGRSLRSVFLIGSYMDGSYAPDSDVDCCIVWKDGASAAQRRKGFSLFAHVSRMVDLQLDPMYNASESPLYRADTFAADTGDGEYPCGPILKLAVKEHSLLLWGEDIRSGVVSPARKELEKDAIAAPLNWIKQTHYGSLDAAIVPPLNVPAPHQPDLGYGDLKHVATFILHAARALICLKGHEFLFDKRRLPEAFATHVGGEWTSLVSNIALARYGNLPSRERDLLHKAACHGMTDFLNHLLREVEVDSPEQNPPERPNEALEATS